MYKITYIGDDTTTEFPFSFPFFQNADVRVCIDDRWQDASDYSVYANEDLTGGLVTFQVAPADGTRIDIFRQVELSRVIDYQPTAQIDPEDLNADFNLLLAAINDIRAIDINVAEWQNVHDGMVKMLEYTNALIEDKLGGGAVLGLYKNLLGVLDNALPELINDYGYITDPAPNENRDDYGIL